MNISLKKFQEKVVDFLIEKTNSDKDKIIIHSPTGSGKTIIMISFIERFLSENENYCIVWFTPGKGELEEQSKEKMEKFTKLKTGNLRDILNTGFENNTSYFINWETVTKKGNIAINESERKNLYEHIAEAHRKNLNFILIIDEEHNNNTSKAQTIIDAIDAKYEIRVSATPVKREVGTFYKVNEEDVINEELITKYIYINYGLNTIENQNITIETDLLLERANEVRKEIISEYKKINENINPLVLIQFPNLNDELIECVENKLNDMGYSYNNKMVASWFSAEKGEKSKKLGKINLKDIENLDSSISFLLFKQAISTGWDCPRAKILIKLRENMEETFEIQTLGRLRRMPKAVHYGNDILDCAYLFTFDEKYKREILNNNSYAYEKRRVFLKEEAKSIKLKKEFRNLDSSFFSEKEARKLIYEYIYEKYDLTTNKIKNRSIFEVNSYNLSDKVLKSIMEGKYITLDNIVNESKAITYEKIINFEEKRIFSTIIDELKKVLNLDYKLTKKILKTLFYGNDKNKKYKLLNLNKNEFIAFIINNKKLLKELFLELSSMNNKQKLIIDYGKIEDFFIPHEEQYKMDIYKNDDTIYEKNVYKDYNAKMVTNNYNIRSTSEILFERYCESSENVELVYKNGDSGINYLSIVYYTNVNEQKLFYPDYIIKLKNGDIYIIETKGGEIGDIDKNIDEFADVKFKALKDYCEKYKYKFGFVRDKDNELYFNDEEYVDNMNNSNWKLLKNIF